MATVQIIETLEPHPFSPALQAPLDNLDRVHILGFEALVPHGTFVVGQRVIFIEIDHVLPLDQDWCSDLVDKEHPNNNRVRYMKFCQLLSQGLVVPLSKLGEGELRSSSQDWQVGQVVTEALGILKWSSRQPHGFHQNLSTGLLPHGIPCTQEKRAEALPRAMLARYFGRPVQVTLKVDGQSCTVFHKLATATESEDWGITSRRILLTKPAAESGSEGLSMAAAQAKPYLDIVAQLEVQRKLADFCRAQGVSMALRFESHGPSIQKNRHNPSNRSPASLSLYGVYLLEPAEKAGSQHTFKPQKMAERLELPLIPILEEEVLFSQALIDKYVGMERLPNGDRLEGVVVQGSDFSFKVLNAWYDMHRH